MDLFEISVYMCVFVCNHHLQFILKQYFIQICLVGLEETTHMEINMSSNIFKNSLLELLIVIPVSQKL